MPIYKGNTKLGTIYHGGTKIGKVYKGSTLVYSGGTKMLTLKYNVDNNGICSRGFFDGINYLPGQPLMLDSGLSQEGFTVVEKITAISDTSLSIANNRSYRNPFNINIGTLPFVGWISAAQANMPTGMAYVITSPKAQVGDYCIQGDSWNIGFGWSGTKVSSDDGTTVTYNFGNSTTSFNKSIANASMQYLYRA